MSRGLPRVNIQVAPRVHEQMHALALSQDTTVSELLRRAVDDWDEQRVLDVDHKSRALSVRLSDKQRRKIAKLARRLRISKARCLIMMLEPLLEIPLAPGVPKKPAATPAEPRQKAAKPAPRQKAVKAVPRQKAATAAPKQKAAKPVPRQKAATAAPRQKPAKVATKTTRPKARATKQPPARRSGAGNPTPPARVGRPRGKRG